MIKYCYPNVYAVIIKLVIVVNMMFGFFAHSNFPSSNVEQSLPQTNIPSDRHRVGFITSDSARNHSHL